MAKTHRDDGSKPCKACSAYTKIQLPCGSWVCVKALLTGTAHS